MALAASEVAVVSPFTAAHTGPSIQFWPVNWLEPFVCHTFCEVADALHGQSVNDSGQQHHVTIRVVHLVNQPV